ncbi:MAG: hypothetical protein EOP84_17985 [Verrucomicrobiaceae bacterium]|nr:MAG: hypothetical protein EOP84_17985 [Verrucomicrobiaceae bacterium]
MSTLSETHPVKEGAGKSAPQILHSLQEIPPSVGHVSSGPFGPVARKDHTSWKTKSRREVSHWSGRIDAALGERLNDRPIPIVVVLLAVGFVAGLTINTRL